MFYNFKKNKKAFTLVELIVVIAIIAILGAVVGVTVSSFVDKARVSAAKEPLTGIVDNWESYKIDSPNKTVKEVVAELFPNDKTNFLASASTVWSTKVKDLTSGTVYIYFHNDSCGKYYGQLKIESGAFKKDNVSTVESKPTGAVDFPS